MIYAAIGGIVPIWLLSLLFGWLLLKNAEAKKKIIVSVSIAFAVAIIISGFGNANGGPFNPMIVEYVISAVIVICIRLGIESFKTKASDSQG